MTEQRGVLSRRAGAFTVSDKASELKTGHNQEYCEAAAAFTGSQAAQALHGRRAESLDTPIGEAPSRCR